jgi:hypothetical protein
MTQYRVDGAQVLALGASLAELAESLALAGDPEADRWALGPGESGAAVEELLGGWRLARLRLAEQLTGLGEATVTAGGLYVSTESGVGRELAGGGW